MAVAAILRRHHVLLSSMIGALVRGIKGGGAKPAVETAQPPVKSAPAAEPVKPVEPVKPAEQFNLQNQSNLRNQVQPVEPAQACGNP